MSPYLNFPAAVYAVIAQRALDESQRTEHKQSLNWSNFDLSQIDSCCEVTLVTLLESYSYKKSTCNKNHDWEGSFDLGRLGRNGNNKSSHFLLQAELIILAVSTLS